MHQTSKTFCSSKKLEYQANIRISRKNLQTMAKSARVSSTKSLLLVLLAFLAVDQLNFSKSSHGFQSRNFVLAETSKSAIQATLLDTTEQSVLGWTKYPDGGPQARTPGWKEESFTNFEREINWRSFVVCDVDHNSVNNWLWSPFIERNEANRLYIEIKFTMRDCNLFPQMVLSCKETFSLLYNETDSPMLHQSSSSSNASSFAQSDSYTFIDSIAADEGRFTSNTDVVINTEIRSIPVNKRGVYFAFRDQGACLSLISIKVYHLRCPPLTTNLAHFNSTPTGKDLTSLIAVEGQCVSNSIQIEQPKMFCAADGNWNSISSGQCKCLSGYEPVLNQTKCQACPVGKFKPTIGDSACQTCPEHSSALYPGSIECKCHEGFHRANKDSKQSPCTQAPGSPSNLSAIYVDSTSVILQWQAPKLTGGREDITYKLFCDQCDQTMVSSPQYYANFSETKCVLSGLTPSSSYRFVVYSMNGLSNQLAGLQAPQYSEITVQTMKPIIQTPSNTLSEQGGFRLSPIYNFRALPGARGTDMVLSWDVQAISSGSQLMDSGGVDGLNEQQQQQQVVALYEIRFQPRYSATFSQDNVNLARRSPYPSALLGPSIMDSSLNMNPTIQQSVTTTNKAVSINTLQPRTEYAFQIRLKFASSNQWNDFSEPVYMSTTNQIPSLDLSINQEELLRKVLNPLMASNPRIEEQQTNGLGNQTSGSWLSSLLLMILCILIALAFVSITLIHYRKSSSNCLQSLGGFGTLSAASTYGGVYGSGASSDLMGIGGPLAVNGSSIFGASSNGNHHLHHNHLHHHTMSAGSGGGLISGSNATSRSSSGNVVQNFLAATLGQISGQHNNSNNNQQQILSIGKQQQQSNGIDKTLFASSANPLLLNQRNHYHQTLSNGTHTMLLSNQQQHLIAGQTQQQATLVQQQLNGQCNQQPADLFKYRTLSSQPGAQFVQQQQQQQDPQLHIYDDLDNNSLQRHYSKELEPQGISIESVIGRGEFGDVCLGQLRSPITGVERRVAVKTLKAQASDKAKLDFLIEASIMSQFEHTNIIHLEGVVTKSEPPMIVTELMENGSLDSYLRENKNRFTCLQLISMLRGIANGMQYLAKLNYVHKDLAARNILVNDQLVCKIADFGLSSLNGSPTDQILPTGEVYTNDSTSTNSSNTLSSQTTGSTPNTASTIAGSNNLNQLQTIAEQLAQQRFTLQQQQPITPTVSNQPVHSIQNPKIPVRWTALEAMAFRHFTSASDVWSFGIVCWEVMTQGERPYWNWSNQDVIKAIEQGYRLPQPDGCPDELYKMMLDCWLKDRAARPTFTQILKTIDRLLSPYDDPFCQLPANLSCPPQQQPQLVPPIQTRISKQEPAYYDTYNPISQLMSNKVINQQQTDQHQSVDEWLDSIKMSRYKENFQRHQINSIQYVARLSQADLNLIGVQNGQHVKKILAAIMSLRSSTSIGASGEGYLV